ncbi:hypothetical protein EDD11_004191 [Mortierella claussenii]|nr:hypothetical protein EDD11_004191 [Mortierella claussenii]
MYSPSISQPPIKEEPQPYHHPHNHHHHHHQYQNPHSHRHHQHHHQNQQPYPSIPWCPQQVPGVPGSSAHTTVPFQPPILFSQQQQQQVNYLLPRELQQPHSQGHLQQQTYHTHHQQQQPPQQPNGLASPRPDGHPQHGNESGPYASQYWPQYSHQLGQPYTQQHVSTEPYPTSPDPTAAAAVNLDWSHAIDYSAKNLIAATTTAPKGLNILPIVVNPAQLQTHAPASRSSGLPVTPSKNDLITVVGGPRRGAGEDCDSVEGTEQDDHEVRLHLLEEPYFASTTPPLSPHTSSHYYAYPRPHPHPSHSVGLPSRGLIQSLAGLTTSDLTSPHYGSASSPATSLSPGVFYPTGAPGSLGGSVGYFTESQSPSSQLDQLEDDGSGFEKGGPPMEAATMAAMTEEEEAAQEEERLFLCPQCEKRFLRQYNLNAHLKTHSLERLHTCEECQRSFLRSYDLSRHQRIHSKDKPYACKICSMDFIRNDAIWRHYRKAHQDHPDVPTSRRDKKKHKSTGGIIGALVTPRVVYNPLGAVSFKSRKAKISSVRKSGKIKSKSKSKTKTKTKAKTVPTALASSTSSTTALVPETDTGLDMDADGDVNADVETIHEHRLM